MTDWGSTWYGDKLTKSGVDLEMGSAVALKRDQEKVLGTPEIDQMVVDILKTGIAAGLYELEAKGEFKKPEWIEKYPAHQQVAWKVNQDGIVLLKNTGILPLKTGPADKILVAGNIAPLFELAGGGSGHVQGYNLKSYLQVVRKTFGNNHVVFSVNPTDDQIRAASSVLVFTGWRDANKQGENEEMGVVTPDKMLVRQMTEGEGHNHPFTLPDDGLISRCTALNPRTIVSLACGGGVQMDWADKAAGIFQAFYGGQTGPEALMDLMTGKVCPSGKLPFSIERVEKDSLAFGEDESLKPGKTLFDPKDLASRTKKQSFDFLQNPDKTECYTHDLPYQEGVFVGYRWYEAKNIEPRFPFGYGLSYTTFGYSDLKVKKTGESVMVSLTVKNTGEVAGAEVVQIYVGEPNASVKRPVRELKGFRKVFLQPGESQQVEVELNKRAFAFWDEVSKGWKVDAGAFVIEAGSSSRDIRLKANITQ
jgi:beta-glucosidase